MDTQSYKIGKSAATSSELQIQGICFQWAWNTYANTRRLLFHVPNGGKRSKVEAAWLKSSGVISGIPDLLLVWGKTIHAFEMKTEKGTVSDAQAAVHKAWATQGIIVHIVRTVDDFKRIFLNIIEGRDPASGGCRRPF